jgi:Putative amidoligase enzyme
VSKKQSARGAGRSCRGFEPTFATPPCLGNPDGFVRSVGFEIEFSELDVDEAAAAVLKALGGEIEEVAAHTLAVSGTRAGDLVVKLDTRYAQDPSNGGSVASSIRAGLAGAFTKIAAPVIPRELVTEPIPITELAVVDEVVAALRRAGADGASSGNLQPLALHLNPETWSFEPAAIASVLKAFALLEGWLRRKSDPRRLRELLGYFGEYPQDYVRQLADPGYWPDQAALIDGYLAANPTRNRDLDALPLLLFLDEDRVRRSLPHEKIGKRPAFHYRLPDSRVGDPAWSVSEPWNTWVAVEEIAADKNRLDALCRDYLGFRGDADRWADRIEEPGFA